MNVKCLAQRLTHRKHKKNPALMNYYYEKSITGPKYRDGHDIEMVI